MERSEKNRFVIDTGLAAISINAIALIKRFLKDTFWGRLDYMFFGKSIHSQNLTLTQLHHFVVDTPPGTSDEHLSVIKLLLNAKPDGAIIITTPQDVALATIRKELNFCCKMGVAIIGLVENMSGYTCPCCHVRIM